jgi:hypothetical protein
MEQIRVWQHFPRKKIIGTINGTKKKNNWNN